MPSAESGSSRLGSRRIHCVRQLISLVHKPARTFWQKGILHFRRWVGPLHFSCGCNFVSLFDFELLTVMGTAWQEHFVVGPPGAPGMARPANALIRCPSADACHNG